MADWIDLVAYDPGLTTGAAWFRSKDGGPFALYDFGVIEGGCEGFVKRDIKDLEVDITVAERYLPDGTVTGEDGIHSLRIEGVLMADSYALGTELVFQPRSDKAALLRTEKARNEWIERHFGNIPTQHAKDAITHALVWFKRNHRPSLEHYFRDDEGPAR